MKLYVGNLPYSTGEQTLVELFSEFGTVESATILRHQSNGHSRGCAFVNFVNDCDAERAITAMDSYIVGGRPIKVSQARERVPIAASEIDPCRIYISGLPGDATRDELIFLASEHGRVTDCFYAKPGSVIIRFDSADAAQRAIADFNGATFRGCKLMVQQAYRKPPSRVAA